MSVQLKITVIAAGLLLMGMTLRSIIKREITEKQSLFWLVTGMGLILLGAFPSIVQFVADLFGVHYGPSIVFAISITFILYGVFNCYKAIADLQKRVQELAMQVSLLNQENSALLKVCKYMNQHNVNAQAPADEDHSQAQ